MINYFIYKNILCLSKQNNRQSIHAKLIYIVNTKKGQKKMKRKIIIAILAAQIFGAINPVNRYMTETTKDKSVNSSVQIASAFSAVNSSKITDDIKVKSPVTKINSELNSSESNIINTNIKSIVAAKSISDNNVYKAAKASAESEFKWNGNTIVKYTGKSVNVIIPDRATAIGDKAFSGNILVKSITIPNSVTSIGSWAFSDCTSLSNVNLSSKLRVIENGAFSKCKSLTAVTLPASVVRMGDEVFSGCKNLQNVVVKGTSLRETGAGIFEDCINLKTVHLMEMNSIPNKMFWEASYLKYIEIPNTITKIGNHAFEGCSSLQQIIIPNSVKKIGEEAFSYCDSLAKIDIPKSVTEIGYNSFSDCENLKIMIINNPEMIIKPEAIINTPVLTIKCYENSTAHKYAKNNQIKYDTSLGESNISKPENDSTTSGLLQGTDGNWYYFVKGKVDVTKNDIVNNENGWFYVKSGKVDLSFNGVARNAQGDWYVKNGQVDFNTNGVNYVNSVSYYGENRVTEVKFNGWYYFKDGKIDYNTPTVAGNSNGWWVIRNGKVDFDYNGIASNDDGDWYCQNGKVNFDANGVLYASGNWYYIQDGKVQKGSETVQGNSCGWWYIGTDGKVDFNYKGIASNENGTWYIRNGQVSFSDNFIYTDKYGCRWKVENSRATRL